MMALVNSSLCAVTVWKKLMRYWMIIEKKLSVNEDIVNFYAL